MQKVTGVANRQGAYKYIHPCRVDGRLTVVAGRCYDKKCEAFRSEYEEADQ